MCSFLLHETLHKYCCPYSQKKNTQINKTKLMIDMGKDEIDNTVKLSSFLAMGSGARGTPALFINEEFVGGYIPLENLESMIK